MLLGLALGAGLAYSKRASSSVPATTDAVLIDPAEKAHPNAETARKAIVNAMTVNSMTLYEMTAVSIETQLRMPKTAANVRTWATMAKQGGHTIAGDEVGGSEGYGDDGDEVGARKRWVASLFRKVTAAKASAKKKKRRNGSSAAASVDWSSAQDDEGGGDEDDDEVGASSRRKKTLPDWLRFSATQSMLAGDPRLIKATAQVMRRMGYHEHAAIHLRALGAPR
jgi:hypothetical protein